jgi:hypothetical protein
MDVNVVVVVYVNTGRPTPLRQRFWLNLRLNSFSRPNARSQELYGAPQGKPAIATSDNGFLRQGIYSQAGSMR